ncbi:MAG: BamA/TamA family outer membrane protein [Alcaligenaceae bacterium]|nr:BamA/TamA family outer membrane protein [Alcaligenaceae bacterium]
MKKYSLLGLLLCLSPQVYAQDNVTDLSATASELVSNSAQTATIAKVTISGDSSIPTDALEQNLEANGIVFGQALNPDNLEVLRQHILDHYRYFRRHEAQVETRVKSIDAGQVEIELYINESVNKQGIPEGYNNDPYADDIYTESAYTPSKHLSEPSVDSDTTVKSNEPVAHTPSADNKTTVHNTTSGDETRYKIPYESVYDETDDESEDDDDEYRRDGTVSLGLGYGNKGTKYHISLIKRRLFGSDASLRLSGLHDRYETNLDLGISKPNFLKEGIRLDSNIFYDSFDNKHSKTAAPYHRKTLGLQALLNFPINRHSSYFAGLRYTHTQIDDFVPEYHRAVYLRSVKQQQWDFKANDLDLVFGWKYNSFNRKFLPSEGFEVKLEGTATLPGSDNKYYKVKLDAEGYQALNASHTWVIGAKASLGYARGMDKHHVPFYQNFSAGGTGSLRGFAYGTVGPRAVYSSSALQTVATNPQLYNKRSHQTIGGNALAAGSIELIMPSFFIPQAYRSNFRTSIFVDAASVWETNDKLRHALAVDNHRSKNIRVSTGLSLQWQFPSGVLSVSYAVPIKKYPGDRTEQLQLNISGSF